MTQKLSWGILGTGRIAGIFAAGIASSQTGQLLAVGSRTQAAAERFGATWHVNRCYASYEQLLADKDVQAVYISTPHPQHAEWAIKAAEAGKHILCEKPIGLDHAQALAIVEAAQRNAVFLMEAFMYRSHPQIAQLRELLQSGIIGRVCVIQLTFAFQAAFDAQSRLFNNALGGGGILDVGCYCVSMARLIAGAASGKAFAEPIMVSGTGHIGSSSVDEYAIASLTFPGDILAQLFCGVAVEGENVVRIFGTEGSLLVPQPWGAPTAASTTLIVRRNDEQAAREVSVESTAGLYALEVDTVATYLADRQSPTMSWQDTLGNMRTLDQWRSAVGVSYSA